MGEITMIEWCDHTFNPWLGCTRVSPACDHCYAEMWAKRIGHPELWQGERRRTTVDYWRQPLKWNRKAADAGVRRRVFCASVADIFDNQVPDEWRSEFWEVVRATPTLDWVLLTKRPQNMSKMLPPDWAAGWRNVWLGTTAENEEEAQRRLPILVSTPAIVRLVSYEPALGPIDFTPWLDRVHWIIAGGESGGHSRPSQPGWLRSVRDQCAAAGVAFHFKQWGDWAPVSELISSTSEPLMRVGKRRAGRLFDGREHNEWPEVAERSAADEPHTEVAPSAFSAMRRDSRKRGNSYPS